jgi:hypothetical protein
MELIAHLDLPVPREVIVGRGTAIFVCGWCFCAGARIVRLRLVLDGRPQSLLAQRMPRLDPYLEQGEQPESYRSGFWGMLRVGPMAVEERDQTIELEAELENGAVLTAPLSRVRMIDSDRTPIDAPAIELRLLEPRASTEPLVAICMATYDPPGDLLAAQLESIRAQTHRNWVCVISDDCSPPGSYRALRELIAGDPRFVLSRSPSRLGFYRNFERALSLAPGTAEFVALADQDDRWDPDKVAVLLERIGDGPLVYSDARLVDRSGGPIADTYWSRRGNNHSDLLSLLVANCVTGAASLLRGELLDDALPFPPAQFQHYHDHWLALVAACSGEIRYVERPLYDYVQHGHATLGHATANQMKSLGDRLRTLRTRGLAERARKWRFHYFVDVMRLAALATVLDLRLGERIAPAKRRVLQQILGAERSPRTFALMAARGARELTGRPETLGAEWLVFGALLWRRLLTATTRELPQRHLRLDAIPPTEFAPAPDRVDTGFRGRTEVLGGNTGRLAAKLEPLPFTVRADAPRRVNILIPTIDLDHLFAGYIAKLNLALRLAERGARVRVVTVDPTPPPPRRWRQRLERFDGLSGLADRVEFAFGREDPELDLSPDDEFIATSWWTAHLAHGVESRRRPFTYLIQEYEPFTFPMGSFAALATGSYELPHHALFSTELLRDYFRRHAIGVYAAGDATGDARSASFQNAITDVSPAPAEELAARRVRRLLFYARPEEHAARNMFELGVLALRRAVQAGAFADGWELSGIGSVTERRTIGLGAGVGLELMPRTDQRNYAELLRTHDLGLALMYTPHPSMVPLEMAAAGMLTVTNSFEHKTAEAMRSISTNLIAAEPAIDALGTALAQAADHTVDVGRRVAGAQLAWSRSWAESFDEAVLSRVEEFLSS